MFIQKNIIIFRIIIFTVLVCFTGCVTSKIEYTESNKLPKDKVYHISEVYMKDGRIINMKGKEPKLKLNYKGIDNVILYNDENNQVLYIPLKDIDKMEIEVLEGNTLVTVIIIVASIILFFLLLFWITEPFKGSITG